MIEFLRKSNEPEPVATFIYGGGHAFPKEVPERIAAFFCSHSRAGGRAANGRLEASSRSVVCQIVGLLKDIHAWSPSSRIKAVRIGSGEVHVHGGRRRYVLHLGHGGDLLHGTPPRPAGGGKLGLKRCNELQIQAP